MAATNRRARSRNRALGLLASLSLVTASTAIPACSSNDDGPAAFPTNGGTPESRDASSNTPVPTPTSKPDAAPSITGAVSSCTQKRPVTAGAPLTCAWLASADNCWAKAVAKVESCGLVAAGKLSTDLKSCTATSGASVTFAAPYPTVPLTRDTPFAYIMNSADGGAACYQLSATTPPPDGSAKPYLPHVALASADGCTSFDAEAEAGIATIMCPDGVGHSATESLSGCDLPTYSFLASGTDAFGFELTYGPNGLGKSPTAEIDTIQCGK